MSHPYPEFENTALWKAIDTAVSELEQNQDIKLTTAKDYVVGYLCQQLTRQKLINDDSAPAK
jgi:G:T/U-mismatch repair DNA glycosylase